MATRDTGNFGEAIAAQFLREEGYAILSQNWKTKYCEIDIVAQKGGIIRFVEVKFRSQGNQGGGLDYITSKKLRQMAFAAEIWVGNHRWTGEYCLSAIAVGPGGVLEFVEDI